MKVQRLQTSFAQTGLKGLIVFLSGASALTYEIVWQREMFHILGASAPATAAILTAIFLGIAFGSQMSRFVVDRVKRPILLLAALEGMIGIWGLLVPVAMSFSETCYVSSAHALGEASTLLTIARFALAIVTFLPSTLCMGASIPVMVRALGDGQTSSVAWIYGLNILGAVVGALATGLIWIRVFGQAETAFVAVGINAAVVVLLLILAPRAVGAEVDEPASEGGPVSSYPWLSTMYFAAGFVALGLEVVWLRFLGIVNSNSTVTFSLTLAFYLGGMGVGSLFLYGIFRRYLAPYTVFAVANGGVAIASLATFSVIYAAPYINHQGIVMRSAAGTLTLSDLYQTEALIIFLLLFVPAVFMGLVYPAVCDSVTGHDRGRQDWIANAYFLGTLGSVFGTLLVSLGMIPWLGLHVTFTVLVIVSAAICAGSFSIAHNGLRRRSAIVVMGVSIVGAVLIAIDARPAMRNTVVRRVDGRWMEFSTAINSPVLAEIVRFQAGASGTAITKRDARNDDHLLYVDDQLVASTNLEAKVDALMLAHLPLLLHPRPKNELTVGFGTGGTSHAITTHGISAYCVGIEPEVPRSAHLLTDQNYGVLEHPLFTLILNDARDHLKITQRQYDVIATDVTNLQYKQNSSLYTVEYFQLMDERLSHGGVACAWIPMAAIARDELRILMKSFQHVFPHATLWFMNHTHTNFGILIGTPERLAIDYSRLEAGFRDTAIAESLDEIGLTEPMQLVHCLHLDEDGYRQFCGDVELHTDNNPTLEFSSPLSFHQYEQTFCENLSSQLKIRPSNFQQYVVNGPAADAAIWQRHQVASAVGCRVILQMYQFQTLWMRGERGIATQLLKDALQSAQAGMEAWPDDKVRENFYMDFFDDANRRINSALRR
jgi:spermidine synthase